METNSPLINELLEFLGESPTKGSDPNMTTLLRQGQAAQQWLLTHYLPSWLELIGSLVDCEYPQARAHRVQLRALSRMSEHLDAKNADANQIMMLHSIETLLQSTLRTMNRAPAERDLQWGLWGRDVPLSIVHGFRETDFMNPMLCEGIAPCCMYAAFLVSQVVTDHGVADEIASKMFEQKPRQLIEIMREIPAAPEA